METYYYDAPTTDDESYIGVLSAANNNNGLDENKNEVGDDIEEVTTNEDQLRWKKIYNELDTFEAQLQDELQDLETAHGIPVDDSNSMKATTKSNRGYRKQKRKDRRGRSNKQHQNSNSSLKYLPSTYTVSSKFSKGNGKSGKKLIKLTHKTSELKDDYQRYLASLNLSQKSSNDMYNEEEEKEAANVYDHVPSSPNNVLPTSTNQQQHLQREWNYYDQEENAPINTGYNMRRTSSSGDVWYDTNNNRYDMSNNSNGGYKRFLLKRGIIIAVAIVVGVICVGTIGIKQTLVSESAEETATNDIEILQEQTTTTAKSFEDVEKELMEEMNEATIEKEEEMLQQAFHDVLKQNFMNKLPDVETGDMPEKQQDDIEVKDETKDETPVLTAQLSMEVTEDKPEEVTVYALAVERYQPKIYNRNNGWEGVTYQQALIFCSMQGMAICPYDAICPDGVKGEPLGGYRQAPNGDWAWIPVIDDFDEYIQGGARERCVRYSHKYDGETPEWDGSFGLDSTDAKLTENLMCCANVM